MTEDSTLSETPTKYVEWKVINFVDLPTENKIESPSFIVSGIKWSLILYPYGRDIKGYVSLYLSKEESAIECDVFYRMGLKNTDGSEFKVANYESTFDMEDNVWGEPTVVQRSILFSSKDTLAPDGSLSIICSIRIAEQRPSTSSVKSTSHISAISNVEAASQTPLLDGIATLSRNFKDMYLKRSLTDVTIAVKSREFLAHKFVLAARSSVFACMFDGDIADPTSRRIEIPDCDPDTFEEFLLFLYTGMLDFGSPRNAINLYNISDKFNVVELKVICKNRMDFDLSIDSFCDVILLATKQNEFDLLKSATDFFIDKAENIISTTKWSVFLEQNSELCNELFLKLLKNKKIRE